MGFLISYNLFFSVYCFLFCLVFVISFVCFFVFSSYFVSFVCFPRATNTLVPASKCMSATQEREGRVCDHCTEPRSPPSPDYGMMG